MSANGLDLTIATPETQKQPGRNNDGLAFHPSAAPDFGVEVELQILDRESGDLAPGAVRILKACQEDGVAGTAAELIQSMIEVKTGICRNVDQAREQLFARIGRVRNIASSLGYDLAMASTHPFHHTTTSTIFPGERYEKILERLQWLTYQRVMFGLHVHVGMPDGDTAIGVINLLVRYLPHLIALSANSPFWQGVDTGLASSRVALYRLLPHAGLPQFFSGWKEFRDYCRVMLDCGTITSFKDIYWDIRPRPDYGTIEVRICDVPPTLTETLALVALVRSLVIASLRLVRERPRSIGGARLRHWIAVENKWLATRYGLKATFVRTPSGKRRGLAQDAAELIEKLTPIARESGDDRHLAIFRQLEKYETGADRQRKQFRDKGSWKGLTGWLVDEFARDLERANAAGA
jgi:glutamate---cysteine ligase / carboxylate-amine ligase